MSKHNIGLIGYSLLSVVSIFMACSGIVGWIWFCVLSMMYLMILIYSSLNIDANYYLSSYNSGEGNNRSISITFDDGPHSENTGKVLDILKEREVKATFFCIGKNIAGNESIIQRIYDEGHIVANHSFCHGVGLDFAPACYVEKDINKTNQAIMQIIGVKPKLFRPPFGVTTPALARALSRMKMICIGWDNRSFDTSSFSDDVLLKRIKKKLEPGSILLLHDKVSRQHTLLPAILDAVMDKSLCIVPLNELLKIEAYE